MKQIDLEPHRHTTRIEIRAAPKWWFPVLLVGWLACGFAVFGTSNWFAYVYGLCGGIVMLAAVGTWPRFFFSDDKNQR